VDRRFSGALTCGAGYDLLDDFGKIGEGNMGGQGSGTWVRPSRKTCVEECLVLRLRDLHTQLLANGLGVLTWQTRVGNATVVFFTLNCDPQNPVAGLFYMRATSVSLRVSLTRTPARWGGTRWWFRCPLTRGGKPCARRTTKLYLPPEGTYFGCRTCWNLTYHSSQTAHQRERFLDSLNSVPTNSKAFTANQT
jgi:hypothetical protein